MVAVTLKQAKAHLNRLVERVRRGEQVVLMRGSKHVAAIVPISDADLRLDTPITMSDEQAARFWAHLEEEEKAGRVLEFESAERAVRHLGRVMSRRRRPRL